MPAIVLFDGVCNFCNGTVRFIVDRDPAGYFQFASLQSAAARPLLERCRLPAGFLDNIVLIEDGVCHARSAAVVRIARRLGGLWPLLSVLLLVPRPLRDAAYDWFARNRYRWYGKQSECPLPPPGLRERFLR